MIDDIEGEQPQIEQDDEPAPGENGTGEGEQVLELTEEAEQPDPEAEKPKNPVQERIDKITAEKHEARRDAEYWRAKALEREAPKELEQQPEESARPKPEDYEFGDADPNYWDALTDWKADQKVTAKFSDFEQRQAVTQQLRELDLGYAQRVAQVKEEMPDYDEVVTQTAKAGKWPLPPLVAIAAKESPVGPKVLYHLATNKDEAIALSNMSPIEQAMEFGRLSAQFAGQTAQKPNIATNAPEPAPARTKGGQFAPSGVLDERLSTDDWMQRRTAQIK